MLLFFSFVCCSLKTVGFLYGLWFGGQSGSYILISCVKSLLVMKKESFLCPSLLLNSYKDLFPVSLLAAMILLKASIHVCG